MSGETPTPPEVQQQAVAAEAAPAEPVVSADLATQGEGGSVGTVAPPEQPPGNKPPEGPTPENPTGSATPENPDDDDNDDDEPDNPSEAGGMPRSPEAGEVNGGLAGPSEEDIAAMEAAKKAQIAQIVDKAIQGNTPRDGLALIGATAQRSRTEQEARAAAQKAGIEYEPPKVDRVEQLLQQYEKSKDKGQQIMAADYRMAVIGYEYSKLNQMMHAYLQQAESTDPQVTAEQKTRFKSDAEKMKLELTRLVQQRDELLTKRTTLDPKSEIADPFKKLAFTMNGRDAISSVEKAAYINGNPLGAIFDKFREIDWKDKDSGEVQQILDNISEGYPKNEAATIQDIVTIMSGDFTQSEKIMKWAKTGGALAALLLAALAYSGFMGAASGKN